MIILQADSCDSWLLSCVHVLRLIRTQRAVIRFWATLNNIDNICTYKHSTVPTSTNFGIFSIPCRFTTATTHERLFCGRQQRTTRERTTQNVAQFEYWRSCAHHGCCRPTRLQRSNTLHGSQFGASGEFCADSHRWWRHIDCDAGAFSINLASDRTATGIHVRRSCAGEWLCAGARSVWPFESATCTTFEGGASAGCGGATNTHRYNCRRLGDGFLLRCGEQSKAGTLGISAYASVGDYAFVAARQ